MSALRDLVGAWTLHLLVFLAFSLPNVTCAFTLTNLWSLPLDNRSDSTPAIGNDGAIYFGTWAGNLWAVNPDGTRRWIFRAGREIKSSPALAADGTVYFGSRDRKLYAIGPDGRAKWQFKTGAWVDASPAVAADGTVLFGSWDNTFYALDGGGVKKWAFQTGGPIVSAAAIAPNGQIHFGSHDGKLYALSPQGAKAWEYAAGGPVISSPALDREGTIYFSSVAGFFYALNSDGTLKWRLRTGGITQSSPVLGTEGTIYVGVNNALWAIGSDGHKAWAQTGQNLIQAAALALADGSVVFLSGNGYLARLDRNQQPQGTYPLNFDATASPVLGPSNTIYIVGGVENVGHLLYAFPIESRLAASSWPTFRCDPQHTGRLK